MKTVMYEVRESRFYEVVNGKVYFPLGISPVQCFPESGDILTTGEMFGSTEIVERAKRSSGLEITQIGDITYRFV